MRHHDQPKPRRPGRRLAVVVLWVALLLAAALVGDALVLVHRIPTMPVVLPGSQGGTTYLLLGSDSRERLGAQDRERYADNNQPTGERADLVLLLRVADGERPRLYSVPRDLYVGQQRDQPHRLGLALQQGPQSMVDSLCADVGVGVDHVLIADMDFLVGAVDASGPVTVSTTAPLRDVRAELSLPTAGTHELDGAQALAWARSRTPEVRQDGRWMPDPSADPTRTRHAAQVLSQVSGRLDDPLTVQRVAWVVGPQLRRDPDLGLRGLLTMSRALDEAAHGGVVTVPARASGTEVPFAFVTAETEQALAPLRTPSCR